jgi:hypothetical protein
MECVMTRIDVYVDPACPWSWVTSRWLTEVRGCRDVEVTWRSFSLLIRDGDQLPQGAPPWVAEIALAASRQSLRLLRAFEALRQSGDESAIDALYAAWGFRVFAPGPPAAPDPGLVPELIKPFGQDIAAAADDPTLDEAITESMRMAADSLGQSPITPTIVVNSVAFAGPLLSAAPTGEAATRLWDAIHTAATEPAFHSMQRSLPPMPSLLPA